MGTSFEFGAYWPLGADALRAFAAVESQSCRASLEVMHKLCFTEAVIDGAAWAGKIAAEFQPLRTAAAVIVAGIVELRAGPVIDAENLLPLDRETRGGVRQPCLGGLIRRAVRGNSAG